MAENYGACRQKKRQTYQDASGPPEKEFHKYNASSPPEKDHSYPYNEIEHYSGSSYVGSRNIANAMDNSWFDVNNYRGVGNFHSIYGNPSYGWSSAPTGNYCHYNRNATTNRFQTKPYNQNGHQNRNHHIGDQHHVGNPQNRSGNQKTCGSFLDDETFLSMGPFRTPLLSTDTKAISDTGDSDIGKNELNGTSNSKPVENTSKNMNYHALTSLCFLWEDLPGERPSSDVYLKIGVLGSNGIESGPDKVQDNKRRGNRNRRNRKSKSKCSKGPVQRNEISYAKNAELSIRMKPTATERLFSLTLSLLPGEYHYRFIVDGNWRVSSRQRVIHDNQGINMYNVVSVAEPAPAEILPIAEPEQKCDSDQVRRRTGEQKLNGAVFPSSVITPPTYCPNHNHLFGPSDLGIDGLDMLGREFEEFRKLPAPTYCANHNHILGAACGGPGYGTQTGGKHGKALCRISPPSEIFEEIDPETITKLSSSPKCLSPKSPELVFSQEMPDFDLWKKDAPSLPHMLEHAPHVAIGAPSHAAAHLEPPPCPSGFSERDFPEKDYKGLPNVPLHAMANHFFHDEGKTLVNRLSKLVFNGVEVNGVKASVPSSFKEKVKTHENVVEAFAGFDTMSLAPTSMVPVVACDPPFVEKIEPVVDSVISPLPEILAPTISVVKDIVTKKSQLNCGANLPATAKLCDETSTTTEETNCDPCSSLLANDRLSDDSDCSQVFSEHHLTASITPTHSPKPKFGQERFQSTFIMTPLLDAPLLPVSNPTAVFDARNFRHVYPGHDSHHVKQFVDNATTNSGAMPCLDTIVGPAVCPGAYFQSIGKISEVPAYLERSTHLETCKELEASLCDVEGLNMDVASTMVESKRTFEGTVSLDEKMVRETTSLEECIPQKTHEESVAKSDEKHGESEEKLRTVMFTAMTHRLIATKFSTQVLVLPGRKGLVRETEDVPPSRRIPVNPLRLCYKFSS